MKNTKKKSAVMDEKKWAWMEKMIHQSIKRYKDGGFGYSREDCVHDIQDEIKLYLKSHNTKIRKKIRKELEGDTLALWV